MLQLASVAVVVSLVGLVGLGACGDENLPPEIDENLTVVLDEDSTTTFDLMAHIVDPEGDQLWLKTLKSSGSFSRLGLGNDGMVKLNPAGNFHGVAQIDFEVTDYHSTVAGTITVRVNPVEDAPVAWSQVRSDTQMNTPVLLHLNGEDYDRDPLTFEVVTPPAHGRLTGTPPILEYTPDIDFVGDDELTYQASDGKGKSLPAKQLLRVLPPT